MGLKHSIFITTDDSVYGCGDNCKGALGITIDKAEVVKHHSIKLTKLDDLWKLLGAVKSIKTSWNNTFILTDSGDVFSTGYGKLGQLGFTENSKIPDMSFGFKKISFIDSNSPFEKLIIGSDFCFALNSKRYYNHIEDMQIYSWGWNEHYNLGLGHNKNSYEPQLINNDTLATLINTNTNVNVYFNF
jgi:alpha-tubulin suppressor-like RCC1 family protein